MPPPDPEPRPADRTEPPPPRVLFLDDDPLRAEEFLERVPQAVWVQTAADCVDALAEVWDEVHLDHDLGGETFVDMGREDCGMEVVRWLTLEPRPHLKAVRFTLHSHNPIAAATMAVQLVAAGFYAELRPFGAPPAPSPPADDWFPDEPRRPTLSERLRGLFRRDPGGPAADA